MPVLFFGHIAAMLVCWCLMTSGSVPISEHRLCTSCILQRQTEVIYVLPVSKSAAEQGEVPDADFGHTRV